MEAARNEHYVKENQPKEQQKEENYDFLIVLEELASELLEEKSADRSNQSSRSSVPKRTGNPSRLSALVRLLFNEYLLL